MKPGFRLPLKKPANRTSVQRARLKPSTSSSWPFLIMCIDSMPGNENACAAKGLESEHRPHHALDGPVVLLHDVGHTFALTQLDVRPRVILDAPDRSRIGAALVDGDRFGHTALTNCALQKLPSSCQVSLGTQQKSKVRPSRSTARYRSSIGPRPRCRSRPSSSSSPPVACVAETPRPVPAGLHRPTMDCGVIDADTALGHHFVNMPQAQGDRLHTSARR